MRGIAQPRSNRPDRIDDRPDPPRPRDACTGVRSAFARFLADALTATPRARQRAVAVVERRVRDAQIPDRAALRRRLYRRRFILRLTSDRALPLAIALIVVIAAGASLAPAAAPVGAAEGAAAISFDGDGAGPALGRRQGRPRTSMTRSAPRSPRQPSPSTTARSTSRSPSTRRSSPRPGMLQHYKVKDGDTLTGIASRFGVSMMTVWWANKLETEGLAQGRPGPDHPAGQRPRS